MKILVSEDHSDRAWGRTSSFENKDKTHTEVKFDDGFFAAGVWLGTDGAEIVFQSLFGFLLYNLTGSEEDIKNSTFKIVSVFQKDGGSLLISGTELGIDTLETYIADGDSLNFTFKDGFKIEHYAEV